MEQNLILVLRIYSTSTIASFEIFNHYDDVPYLADEISNVLGLQVLEILDGPSERIVKFNEPNLSLINNPYGTELIATTKKARSLLENYRNVFVKKYGDNCEAPVL